MDVPAGPAGAAAVVEAQLVVGIPVGRADPASEMERDSRHPVAGGVGLALQHTADLGGQLGRHPFVGVEREDPVVAGLGRRVVLLCHVPGPRAHGHPWCEPPGDLHRGVGAAGIDDHDLVGPRHRLERGRQIGGLVARDHRDRQLRHGRILSGIRAWLPAAAADYCWRCCCCCCCSCCCEPLVKPPPGDTEMTLTLPFSGATLDVS